MKRRGEHGYTWGEGRLIAAALGILTVLSFAFMQMEKPRGISVQAAHAVSTEAVKRAETVNVNTADARELSELPGIGEELAMRIVQYRIENGSFAGIEEIMNVPGVGEGKFAAVRELIFAE